MADDFDPEAYLASKQASKEDQFDPEAYLRSKRPERGVLERAGSAVAETAKAGFEHAGKALSPPRTVHAAWVIGRGGAAADPETYKKGATEALTNLKDTGLDYSLRLTMTVGRWPGAHRCWRPVGRARLAQTGIKKGAETLAPESRLAKARFSPRKRPTRRRFPVPRLR
jgi:hypothetical protein